MSAVSTTSSRGNTLRPSMHVTIAADGVDLAHGYAGTGSAHRGGRALADVTIAADHGVLAGKHHVGRAHDAVGQRVLAAIEVV